MTPKNRLALRFYILPGSLIHALVLVTSFFPEDIDTILTQINQSNQSTRRHGGFYKRLDGYSADIDKPLNNYRTRSFNGNLRTKK